MSFDERIRSKVDQALGPLVQQLIGEAAAERDEAVRAAEASVRATLDEKIAQAREQDREAAAREIRTQLEGEMNQKMRDALDAAEQRHRAATADREAKAAEDVKTAVASARIKEREIEMSCASRLLESVRGLDGATSLSEVLDALGLAAAKEAARAAVVVLRGDRIQGWRLSGFGPRDKQPKSVDLALAESGVIGHAVTASRAVNTKDSPTAAVGPGFEALPADRMGLAVPVIVAGRVVAIVYADAVSSEGGDRHVPSSWPEVIEVLARHAGRCLEALASQKSAPRVAPPAGSGAGASASPGPGPSALRPML